MMLKDIAIVYNPALITEYVSNNVQAFRYPDPEAVKANTKASKSRPIGMTPMKGYPLIRGVNWIDAEYLEFGIRASEKGQDWLERGVLRLIEKRPLASTPEGGIPDTYTGTIADYKGKTGASTEFSAIRLIITNTYDRDYLNTLNNQCPALFQGEGVAIISRACMDQIKRIEAQFSSAVSVGDLYRAAQVA